MRKIIPLSILVLLLITGCAGYGGHKGDKPLDTTKAYVALKNPEGIQFTMTLMNMNTEKKAYVNVYRNEYVAYEMDPGIYAILSLSGQRSAGNVTYTYPMITPVSLMRTIKIEPGKILFLGKHTIVHSGRTFSQSLDYDLDEAYYALNELYPNFSDLEFLGL